MKKRYSHHKGISLFELLIVIALIVILSSAFILSSINTSASGDAAKIIANLTTIKQAATSWYADHRDTVREMYRLKKKLPNEKVYIDDISKYLGDGTITLNDLTGGSTGILKQGTYGIFNVIKYRTAWYAGYRFDENEEAVKEKLKGRQETLGLHFSNQTPNPNNLSPGDKNANVGDDIVWMHILGDLTKTDW